MNPFKTGAIFVADPFEYGGGLAEVLGINTDADLPVARCRFIERPTVEFIICACLGCSRDVEFFRGEAEFWEDNV